MRYREKRYDCGEYMEVEVFALPPGTKPLKRARREKESTPKRKQLNDTRSIKQFVRLANTNFHRGDFAVELTFNRHNLPGSPEELAKEVIRGDWGNGDERKKKLREAGYDPAVIQAKVNEILHK